MFTALRNGEGDRERRKQGEREREKEKWEGKRKWGCIGHGLARDKGEVYF